MVAVVLPCEEPIAFLIDVSTVCLLFNAYVLAGPAWKYTVFCVNF